MNPFDLAAAKAGAAVCTINGEPVRIICTNRAHDFYTVVALVEVGGYEDMRSYTASGVYDISGRTRDDGLMMRDDDYAEKLARGEYGPTVKENLTVDTPTCKESLPVDRVAWRREFAEKAMLKIIEGIACHNAKNFDDNRSIYSSAAYDAVAYADALLAELEKK